MPFLWEVSGISIYLSDAEFVTSDNYIKYFQPRVKFSRISGISIYQRWSLVGKDDYLCWKLICNQILSVSVFFIYHFCSYIRKPNNFLFQISSSPYTFPSPNNVFLFLLCSSSPLRIKFSFNYFPPFSSSIFLLLWGAKIFVSSSKNRIHKLNMV